MVADSRPGSAKKGRVYVTWTRFQAGTGGGIGRRSPIVFSQSTDGAATWSRSVIISGTSGSFCTIASGTPDNPNACDQDQGSHPVVGPDGTIYVIFGNSNTPTSGVNQHLIVRCPKIGVPVAGTDCSVKANWSKPVKISDDIGTQPTGPDATSG